MKYRELRVVYILPSRYDDEGYVYRYQWGVLPSNTLTCLRALTEQVEERRELGEDVRIHVDIYDDTVQRIPVEKIVRQCRREGSQLLVGMVAVQSNQFARAGDLALRFREHDVPVMVGGFHISGVLALFDEPDRDMQRLMNRGISLVSGEVEGPGVLAAILRDALEGRMKSLYQSPELPDIYDAAIPQPDVDYMHRFTGRMGTIDTSRGCPFSCSFCTIVNVQGRKVRHRSSACILKSIEEGFDNGILRYFFTDDNFSRSPIWEELFDGLAELHARGKTVQFMMQVDTQAWRIKGFVESAAKAGCFLTFIGMESINEANLAAMHKPQNNVHQYAAMTEAWHRANVMVHVGYIIGLPHDTPESVRADIATLKDQIKVDEASFFMLTPLPGSRDHQQMVENCVPIDADLNNLDGFHEVFAHPNFKPGEWRAAYDEAWDSFYNKENVANILLRCSPERYWHMFWLSIYNRQATLFQTHPMITGLIRYKGRKDRRPIFPRESISRYYWRRTKDTVHFAGVLLRLFFEYQEIWLLTRKKGDSRYALLTDLRVRWAECRQNLRISRFASRWDDAAAEIKAMLQLLKVRIEEFTKTEHTLSRRLRKALRNKAAQAGDLLRTFEAEEPSERSIREAERYITETLLRGYEELTVSYVAMRRRCNTYRHEVIDRLKRGRLLKLRQILTGPIAALYETILGLHFASAFIRGIIIRLKVPPENQSIGQH